MRKSLTIYTDGGARGNPGPAGIGVVIFESGNDVPIKTVSRYLGQTTNNQAEYLAIIEGLKSAKTLEASEVFMFMDSELAVRQLNGLYKVKNAEIAKRFLEVHNLVQSFQQVIFQHVRREKNKIADALVNKAIDEAIGKK